jgi:DNA-directed RNA polymerase specialized sigma24 family protein
MAEPDLDIPDEEYRSIRERLITFFRVHRRTDPEAHADEVIYRAIRRIREGASIDPSLRAFCLGVARNVLRESFKEKELQELSKDPSDERGGEFAHLSRVEQMLLLNECLHSLPPDERRLFLEYHLGDRQLLAKRRNQSPNALRIQVHRIARKVLKSVQPPPLSRGESQ